MDHLKWMISTDVVENQDDVECANHDDEDGRESAAEKSVGNIGMNKAWNLHMVSDDESCESLNDCGDN
jgi:hypothetical protein